ncbi:serine threonine protein kinase with wd40 repeats [Stylonychia lemnae]|uniref:Serine threonine protein kinase with wd40 repeats n=1 Tax=Stylonychia lemnae TaxID=5949 RepID=A0A078B427_STYLE|nr:serine threonine protein kinase with wd40 repeats [Stylonychia lemnae]|eukprot:CDW89290.1 serine threonine protein kinase with wd40 repeats [Stylonychia lemnae]
MGNKNAKRLPLNILKIPIYAIASYQDYVFLGGGGGYEIENLIEVYHLENPSQNILNKKVHEEPCGTGVPNYFELAHNVIYNTNQFLQQNLNLLATCIFANVVLYKIERETGKLLKLQEFQADFKKEEASVNCCRFSRDNSLLATGSDDFHVRVFKLNTSDYKSQEKLFELPGHFESINSVDFSPDNKYLISSSTDASCIIFNLEKKGQKVQKLTFNDGLGDNPKNMLMRGCFFTNDNKYIYTLATQTRSKSYLIKWQNKENYEPAKVTLVHNTTSSGMRISPDGKQIGIMTSDGFVKVMNEGQENFTFAQKRHRLPVTCLGFKTNVNGGAEFVLSGSPDYTYNIINCKSTLIGTTLSFLLKLMILFGVVFILIGFV